LHLLDTGHFALEEDAPEIGRLIHAFLDKECAVAELPEVDMAHQFSKIMFTDSI
jgi:hypothetical protein